MSSITHAQVSGNVGHTLGIMDWPETQATVQVANRARLADLAGEAELSPEDLAADVLEVLENLHGDSPALRFVRRLLADTARGIRATEATSYDQFTEREQLLIRDYSPGGCSRCNP